MKKTLISFLFLFILNGCAESIALLGTGASNGRIVQSSLNSAISYGLKTQTGKTPIEHAIAFAEKKNPGKKKDTCISSIEKIRSELCTIAKKKISLTTALKEKTPKIIKNNSKEITTSLLTKAKETSLIEKIAKKSVIYNRR